MQPIFGTVQFMIFEYLNAFQMDLKFKVEGDNYMKLLDMKFKESILSSVILYIDLRCNLQFPPYGLNKEDFGNILILLQ